MKKYSNLYQSKLSLKALYLIIMDQLKDTLTADKNLLDFPLSSEDEEKRPISRKSILNMFSKKAFTSAVRPLDKWIFIYGDLRAPIGSACVYSM
jgi:hypothetical protein